MLPDVREQWRRVMSGTKTTGNGIGFGSLLLLTFIILKLCGVIGWSWWWVLSPLWIGGGLILLAAVRAAGGGGGGRGMSELGDKKCARCGAMVPFLWGDVCDACHRVGIEETRQLRALFNQANPTVEPKLAALVADCKGKMDAQREALAAYAHEAWAGWMRYLFEKGDVQGGGGHTIRPSDVERWQRQMEMPYAELPEVEKASDRAQADRILAIMRGEG